MIADLHIHTTASDGKLTPVEAVLWAKSRAIDVMAITDHDSVGGLEEGSRAAKEAGIRFVNGIELSCYTVCEVHILGYNFDYHDAAFLQRLQDVKEMRRERNVLIGQKLARLGVTPDIDFTAEGLGRMNIARRLVEEGYVRDVSEAFERYLGVGGKAFAESRRLTPKSAVKMLKEAGAFCAIAHPKKFLLDGRLDLLVSGLKPEGLDGLEVNYPGHTDQDKAALSAMCKRYGLLPTGGSDYHGDEDKNFDFELDPRTARRLLGKFEER